VCLALLGAAGPTTALPALAAALAGAGFGLGVFQVPNMSAAMSAFGATQQGVAGGIMFFSRTLGTVFGVATLAQLFAARRAVLGVGAFNECFVVAALGVAAAAVLGGVWARRGV
jgi:hypothetical protein